jgi:reactive intermediate/imine deaminase
MRHALVVFALLIALGVGFLMGQSPRATHINPPALSTPTGYTHVVVPARGRLVFLAGQVALDSSGTLVGKGDFKAQTEQVFQNLKSAIEAAGGTMADIVKTNVYVTDSAQLQAYRDVRQKYFPRNPPASTFVQVVRLAREEFLVEVEAIAAIE